VSPQSVTALCRGIENFAAICNSPCVLSQGPRQRSVKTGWQVSYTGCRYNERRALNAAVRVPSSR